VGIDNSCNLLIDADDTLWENNVYYESVIHQVLALLCHNGVDAAGFRARLDDTERKRIPAHGYGTVNFTHSLVETVRRFLPADADSDLPTQVEELSLSILHHPLEILDGVPETLAYLSIRHQLFLVTKGNPEEQSRKIRESNLQDYFHGVEILPEKNVHAYTQLLSRYEWEGTTCWMIGNSPRSDINPALAAGMHAIYIPHPHTWTLEHEEPAVHPRLLELEKFSDLKRHF
jgi:putative hydrolase of the HAD superfamily